jgi:oligoendopeptidase F
MRGIHRGAVALLSVHAVAIPAAAAQARQVAPAPTAPVVWDLREIFTTPAEWEAERRAILAELPGLASLRGRLGEGAATLADAVERTTELRRRVSRVATYANLLSDEDRRIQENLARRQQGQQLASSYGEAIAWMRPELIAVGADRVEQFIRTEPRLADHAFNLRDIVRAAPHTLSAEGEQVTAAFGAALAGPQNVYAQMSNSDIPWPTVRIDGQDVRIDNQGYTFQRAHADRDVRRSVFDAFYRTWAQYESSLGQVLAAHVRGRATQAELRDFSGSREAALFANNLPVGIYDMLISQTREGLPILYRYFRLRERMLGVEDLSYYDIYPDLLDAPDVEYDLTESARLTLAALEPLGPEYLAALRSGLDARWVHAYPAEGKASGAYVNSGVYGLHPYVLLNHQNDYASLSTFAHEWGHAVHSVLAQDAQPYATASYSIFVAEMASTINELLLLRYLQANAVTPEQRLFFLSRELENYRGTFFRQAMFAEFEARIYALAEQGEALTGERLTREYLDLLEAYHGTDQGVMTIDPAYALEWAYIPHFYLNFYVFQYATSIAASSMFTERLMAGAPGASEAVVDMLRRGGSAYPHEMFVEAGVDLTSPAPYQTLLTRMDAVMDEMEAILARGSR